MHIENDVPLQNLNTFGVPAAARYFAEFNSALSWANDPVGSSETFGVFVGFFGLFKRLKSA